MSEERKKHIRTQGRYSDSGRVSFEKKQKISPSVKEPSENRVPRRYSNESRRPNHSSSEEVGPPVTYEGNSDYSFKELETPKKPIEIIDQGKLTLSKTENGESLIFYEPYFLLKAVGWDYFDCLKNATNWYSKNIVIHGEEHPQPRLVAWYGPYPYTYSGATLEPAEMPDTVLQIKNSVEKCLEENGMKANFNSVLLNLYRNGRDSVAWHSDDESTMGISPTIASVSLGETRKFEMKRKKRYSADESRQNEEIYFVNLKHGSLVVMDGCMQEDWQHRVPKEYHDKGPRINLTFRTVFPIEKTRHYPVKEFVKKSVDDSYSTKSTKSSKIISFDDENFPPLSSGVTLDNSAAEYSYVKNKEHINETSENKDNDINEFLSSRNVEVHDNNDGDAFDTIQATNPVKFTERNVREHDSSVENSSWVSVKSPVNNSEDEHLDHRQHLTRKWVNERHKKGWGSEKPPKKSFNEKPDKIWTDEERYIRDKTQKKEVRERIPKKWINEDDSGKQWRNRQRSSENWNTKEPLEKWEDEETSKKGSCEEPSMSERPRKKWVNPVAPPKKSFNEKPDNKSTNEERWVRDKPHKEVTERPSQKWINDDDSSKQRVNRQTLTKKYFNEERQSENWDTEKPLEKCEDEETSGKWSHEDPTESWDTEKPLEKCEDEETSGKWSHEDPTESWANEKHPQKKFYEKADKKCYKEDKWYSDKFPRQIVSEKSSEKWANEECSEKWVAEETSDTLEKPSSRLVNEDSPQQWVGEERTPGKWTNKETGKNWLNVEAKEFVPNNSCTWEVFQPNQVSLEDLLYYEVDFMIGKKLQDHAFLLKNKVEERVRNFNRYDRDELEFLCTLTDGSQSDKNQKLIIKRMCNILINKLQTLSNDEKSYNRSPPSRFNNSRKHVNGNQNYADNGRRYGGHFRGNGNNNRF